MKNYFEKVLLPSLTIALVSLCPARGTAAAITAPGTADIYAAGLASPPTGASLPPSVSFTAGAGQVLTVTSVTGNVTFGGGLFCPADGCASGFDSVTGTNIDPTGGLSGIIDDPGHFFFLAGVFLTGSAPSGAAPATLDFTGNEDFTSLSPQIAQVFYIGNGMTSSSQVQQFQIPVTATRAFFGFIDGNAFHGPPTFYNDNGGQLSFTATVANAPEPGSLAVASAAALLFLVWRSRLNWRS